MKSLLVFLFSLSGVANATIYEFILVNAGGDDAIEARVNSYRGVELWNVIQTPIDTAAYPNNAEILVQVYDPSDQLSGGALIRVRTPSNNANCTSEDVFSASEMAQLVYQSPPASPAYAQILPRFCPRANRGVGSAADGELKCVGTPKGYLHLPVVPGDIEPLAVNPPAVGDCTAFGDGFDPTPIGGCDLAIARAKGLSGGCSGTCILPDPAVQPTYDGRLDICMPTNDWAISTVPGTGTACTAHATPECYCNGDGSINNGEKQPDGTLPCPHCYRYRWMHEIPGPFQFGNLVSATGPFQATDDGNCEYLCGTDCQNGTSSHNFDPETSQCSCTCAN